MRTLLLLLAVAGLTCSAAAIAAQEDASVGKANVTVSELTGVFHRQDKALMPYLVADGSDERCYLRGAPLATRESGTRLYVRGTLRTELRDSTGTDFGRPSAPAPPPFRKGWVIYMEVIDAREIDQPFERPPLPPKQATTRDAQGS